MTDNLDSIEKDKTNRSMKDEILDWGKIMCEEKCCYIDSDGDEWIEVRGVRVPKKQYEEAVQNLTGLVEETEKSFEIKGLLGRKNEKLWNNEEIWRCCCFFERTSSIKYL